jgi:hypothetical protein
MVNKMPVQESVRPVGIITKSSLPMGITRHVGVKVKSGIESTRTPNSVQTDTGTAPADE